MQDLMIYRSATGDKSSSSPIHLVVGESALVDMVEQAAATVMRFTDPQSKDYAQPATYMNNSFDRFVPKVEPVFNPIHRRPSGQNVYLQMMRQVDLLTKFAEMVNNNDQYLVGEEWWTRSTVYLALCYMHNWKVACIEVSITLNGPLFGSATGWHTINLAKPVVDWPKKFEWGFEAVVVPLPHERPDWQQRIEEHRKKQQQK